jgi:hypothetical protein
VDAAIGDLTVKLGFGIYATRSRIDDESHCSTCSRAQSLTIVSSGPAITMTLNGLSVGSDGFATSYVPTGITPDR